MMKLILTVDTWYQLDSGRFVKRSKGDLVEVSEQTGAWLLRVGSAKHPEESEEIELSQETETSTAGEIDQAADSEDESSELTESQEEPAEVVDRPANAANRDTWDAYARKQGIDPSQFKQKNELIAALP